MPVRHVNELVISTSRAPVEVKPSLAVPGFIQEDTPARESMIFNRAGPARAAGTPEKVNLLGADIQWTRP
jgi:hypothetical protein